MEVKVDIDYFGGSVEVKHGKVIIKSNKYAGDDFLVFIEKLKSPGVKLIRFFPREFTFLVEQKGGWTLGIGRSPHEKGCLVITRFKTKDTHIEEYLTKSGKWKLVPKRSTVGPYPSNIMKIPFPE